MALSSDQLTDFRGDIGDDGTVFTDDELNRLYTRSGSVYSEAVVLAIRQLLASAVKLHDYRIAQSAESMSQVYDHLEKLLDRWEKIANSEEPKSQVRVVGMRGIPPRDKDEPYA